MSPGEQRLTAAHDRITRSLNRRLVDELASARSNRRASPAKVAVWLLAGVVHLTTAAALVGGLWLLLEGTTWPLRVIGGILVVTALAMLPWIRPSRDATLVDPDRAPETFALIAEVAAAVKAPMPTRVYVDADYNAGVGLYGFRGRQLVLGAPLWVACSPEARTALLAHELGHFANGDAQHGRFAFAAVHAVASWIDVLTPNDFVGEGVSPSVITRMATWPIRAVLTGFLLLVNLLDAQAHRRQEHYADLASVHVAGTAGAIDLLQMLPVGTGVEVACSRSIAVSSTRPLRLAIDQWSARYDASARQAAMRGAAADKSRIDDTHPPTIERIRLVEGVEPTQGVVRLDSERSRRIEQELAEPIDAQLQRLAAHLRGY